MQAQSVIRKIMGYPAEMAGRPPIKEAPEFGRRLSDLRKARGWTQACLAQRLGTTIKMVAYFEREATNPTQKTLEKLSEVFGVSAAELLGQEEGQKSRRPGPASKLEKLTAELSQLPRNKQKVVVDMLEGFLKQTGT
jgi:transcriptional regulator with XRE-family HTH domain